MNFYSSYRSVEDLITIVIVCAVVGLIGGIALLAAFLPASNRGRFFGFTKWLYNFLNFNSFWITTLVKLLNIIILTICFLGGLIILFIVPTLGLILFVAGVIFRILLELTMVTLSIHSNVSNIDSKLSNLTTSSNTTQRTPQNESVCTSCGTVNPPGTRFCMTCGKEL